jgi:hypothetical protein
MKPVFGLWDVSGVAAVIAVVAAVVRLFLFQRAGSRDLPKVDDVPSAVALRLRDFDPSSGFTEQQLLAGLTVPAIADPLTNWRVERS